MPRARKANQGAGVEGVERRTTGGAESRRHRMVPYILALLVAACSGAGATLLLRPTQGHAVSKHAQRALQNRRNVEGRRGPWGLLEYTRIAISMPIEYVPDTPEIEPMRWWFQGGSRESVTAFLAESGLTPEQLAGFGGDRWVAMEGGLMVVPPSQLVIDLAPATRARIYNALAAHERNGPQNTPEIFAPQYIDERLESSGLSDETVGLIRKLLYPRKSWMLFSDANAVLASLRTGLERQRFHQVIHRRMTVTAQLIVDETSNIDAMFAYWNFPGRSKGLRSLFESLARVPGGGELDVSHLLTPLGRKLLYSFPEPSDDPSVQRRDCGWTALNFFNDQPDDRLSHPEHAAEVIQRDYERVSAPAFGDVVALIDADGDSVHLATYLADNLTFTKNGYNATQPWMLMSLEDLVERYSIDLPRNLDVWYFRRKR